MTRAIYTFTAQDDNQLIDIIEFELLDNPGVRAWQYSVMLNNKSRIIYQLSLASFSTELETPSSQYQQLQSIIKELSTTQFSFNYPVPESFNLVTQDFMNTLHRHFTNACITLWSPTENFDQLENLNKLLQDLNSLIHQLERSIPTENKLKYCQGNKEIRMINSGHEIGYDIYPFRQYHSYDSADLILDPYILGKSLIESFMCHDDPTSWDTAGHMRTNGGAIAVLSHDRQDIYNSNEFINWLSNHNLTKQQCHADFPLGNFVSGHKDKLISLQSNLTNYSCTVDIQL